METKSFVPGLKPFENVWWRQRWLPPTRKNLLKIHRAFMSLTWANLHSFAVRPKKVQLETVWSCCQEWRCFFGATWMWKARCSHSCKAFPCRNGTIIWIWIRVLFSSLGMQSSRAPSCLSRTLAETKKRQMHTHSGYRLLQSQVSSNLTLATIANRPAFGNLKSSTVDSGVYTSLCWYW